jgi:integrase
LGHSFRQAGAFASHLIARGIEPVMRAKLMGHEDTRQTLDTYTGLWSRSEGRRSTPSDGALPRS